jgi:ATP-dependent helicase/nuclease subunit A
MAAIIQLRRESMAEELRVLYVAFTRAREKLILTGSVGNLVKSREKWERYEIDGKFPAHMIFGAGCSLDWLMPVLHSAGNSNNANVKVYYRNISDLLDAYVTEEERDEQLRADMRNLRKDCDASVREALEWSYPLKELAQLPAKLSISEIKRLHNRGQDSMAAEYLPAATVYSPPRFLQGKSGPTPANRGTVMHTVLEHMDMTHISTAKALQALVSGLVERSILTPHEAGLVDYPALETFCQSDIFRRIILAVPNVWRETPFVLGLTPYQIYKKPEFEGIDANILVHGIIDCYFEENGRLVLVDYKTGKKSGMDTLPDEYSVQMSVYKLALERATGKEVTECLLYLFADGCAVKAPLADIS